MTRGHDERFYKAQILVRMFDDPRVKVITAATRVFYKTDRPVTKKMMMNLRVKVIKNGDRGNLDKLLRGSENWTISNNY